jgi:hypothetical protein
MIEVITDRRSVSGEALRAILARESAEVTPQPTGKVNWTGSPLAESLNARAYTNKLKQLIDLGAAEVPTIAYSNRKEGPEWFARRIHHQQGYDFTNRRFRRQAERLADYWVKKEEFTDEFRVHVFRTKKDNMRILRVAKRVPARDDHHPWVRSHRLGWKLSYVGGASEPCIQAARAAMRALHLDFGAVDLGVRPDNSPCVLEVNTCPGIEGGTLELYVDNIMERFDP